MADERAQKALAEMIMRDIEQLKEKAQSMTSTLQRLLLYLRLWPGLHRYQNSIATKLQGKESPLTWKNQCRESGQTNGFCRTQSVACSKVGAPAALWLLPGTARVEAAAALTWWRPFV